MSKPDCQHLQVEEIRTNGDELYTYQCRACLSVVNPCPDCRQPLTFRHAEVSEGCTRCKKGKFCNAQRPLCTGCSPAPGGGYCLECRQPFSMTGREKNRGKVYCTDLCQGRAKRKRAAERGIAAGNVEAVPNA